eukprot:g3400.t1
MDLFQKNTGKVTIAHVCFVLCWVEDMIKDESEVRMKDLLSSIDRFDVGYFAAVFAEHHPTIDCSFCDMSQDSLKKCHSLLSAKLNEFRSSHAGKTMKSTANRKRDVVLYGFGRIGRLIMRRLIEQSTADSSNLCLRAIVVRPKKHSDLEERASLFLNDSIHGRFPGVVKTNSNENTIIANGVKVKLIYSNRPDEVDYTQHGISNAIVVDNTGIWREKKELEMHLRAKGCTSVLLTAPSKGKGIPNIVMGVNDIEAVNDWSNLSIVSAASCSTNAISPVLKLIDEKFGLVHGHVETVHSTTNGQHFVDNLHKKPRRGRAAHLNIVLTDTGAARAVQKVLPKLNGKLTASAIRVPTPNVSMAVCILHVDKANVTTEQVNRLFRSAGDQTLCIRSSRDRSITSQSRLSKQIDFVDSPSAASSDFIGSTAACIVDSLNTSCTTVSNGQGSRVNLYLWYDNENGYSCQCVRMLEKMSQVERKTFPSF